MSVGPRGASVTISERGIWGNVGLPGTGISYRTRLDGNQSKASRTNQHAAGASGERQREREASRLLRAEERLQEEDRRARALSNVKISLDESGKLFITDVANQPLSRGDLSLLWKQNAERIRTWLTEEAEKINGPMEEILDIHFDSPDPNDAPILEQQPYDRAAPILRDVGPPPKEPVPPAPEKRGFLSNVFNIGPSKRQRQLEIEYKDALATYAGLLESFERKKIEATTEWEAEFEIWKSQKERHDTEQEILIARYEDELAADEPDLDFMEGLLENAFDAIHWPRETLISFELRDKSKNAVIDVDLPEIEDFPRRTAQVSENGRSLKIRDKTEKQLRLEYARHIHGVIFITAATAFSTVPQLETLVVSGFSQRADKATGRIEDEYLLSLHVDRDTMSRVDFAHLDRVDPVSALEAMPLVRSMTSTGIFKKIDPHPAQ